MSISSDFLFDGPRCRKKLGGAEDKKFQFCNRQLQISEKSIVMFKILTLPLIIRDFQP